MIEEKTPIKNRSLSDIELLRKDIINFIDNQKIGAVTKFTLQAHSALFIYTLEKMIEENTL